MNISDPIEATIKKKAIVTQKADLSDSICIAAVGDIMLGTSYPDSSTLPADSGRHSFSAALNDLRNADVTFGNLEGCLLDTGAPAHYKLHLRSKAYLFRMPQYYGKVLKDAGFDVLSLANNHIGDFGDAGRKSTMATLMEHGIHYAGQQSHPTDTFTIKGVKYGFCAFAPNAQTVSIHDLPNATRIIKGLKKDCDIVIVSFHGGGEGPLYEHVPFKKESYLTEKRGDVYAFAHNAIDAGADLVLGNGPHVNRAVERYNKRLIAYSLGNFKTHRGVNTTGISGFAPVLKVYINKKGEFLSGQIASYRQVYNTLKKDTLYKAARKIKSLTEKDFPISGLTISDKGLMLPANDTTLYTKL